MDSEIQQSVSKAASYIESFGHEITKVPLDILQKFNSLEISKIIYTAESNSILKILCQIKYIYYHNQLKKD
ncbi:MAG: hypothetical protein CM1200mP7_0820 [Chloroflexota bacterium]|nr:MAG: hypothetical protein CM1200mP7_0820 [Chloroflexota bacterium]